jgi:hypothetical protein
MKRKKQMQGNNKAGTKRKKETNEKKEGTRQSEKTEL